MILTDTQNASMLKQAKQFMEEGEIKVLTPEIIDQILKEYRDKYNNKNIHQCQQN